MRELLYPVIVKYPVTGIIPSNVYVCYTFEELHLFAFTMRKGVILQSIAHLQI